jgi:acetate kinase
MNLLVLNCGSATVKYKLYSTSNGTPPERASAAAIKDGKCIDTSMGATPLEGRVSSPAVAEDM